MDGLGNVYLGDVIVNVGSASVSSVEDLVSFVETFHVRATEGGFIHALHAPHREVGVSILDPLPPVCRTQVGDQVPVTLRRYNSASHLDRTFRTEQLAVPLLHEAGFRP